MEYVFNSSIQNKVFHPEMHNQNNLKSEATKASYKCISNTGMCMNENEMFSFFYVTHMLSYKWYGMDTKLIENNI